ncbi:hypothetical protein LINPERPRIM_LOCUS25705 [Linum perenne]
MAKASSDTTREYKLWSKLEEQTLIACMRDMADNKLVVKGNFKLPHLKSLEKMMHDRLENCQLLAVPHIKSKVRYFKDKFVAALQLKQASGFGWDDVRGCVVADEEIFAGWVKSHPKASGLNNKPNLFFDDLSFIFGVEQATGAHAVQPGDAASKVMSRPRTADYMEENTVEQDESYTIPTDMDHNAVLEDMINQGIDMHATGLKDVEAEITSKRMSTKGKEAATSSGSKRSRQLFSDEDRARIASSMVATSENIGKIADSYCIEGDVAVKRQSLYVELAKFEELTGSQRTRILRHLNRDDGDATTFFQLPTDEEKLEFIWWILQ